MAEYQKRYLPRLVAGTSVAPPASGRWSDKKRTLLADLVTGLDIGEAANTEGVSSIPDLYARPLLFRSEFGQARHPRDPRTPARRVVQEWRGLLSLLALRGVKNGLKLSFAPVNLGQGGILANALTQLAPAAVRLQAAPAPAYDWKDLLLIQLDNPTTGDKITLGAFSPSTLVFTAADYARHLRPNGQPLPFIKPFVDEQGYLRPPLASQDKNDLQGVGEWVRWLIGKLKLLLIVEGQASAADTDLVDKFDNALDAWRDSIREELKNTKLGPELYEPGDDDPVGLARETGADYLETRYEVYRYLLTALRPNPKAAAGSKSECALLLKQRLNAPHKYVVVVHRKLSKSLRLWQDTKREDLGDNAFETLFRESSGSALGGHDMNNNPSEPAIWIRPELFFLTDTLTKAPGIRNFLAEGEAAANGQSASYLLPLKPTVLDYFTVQEIQDTLKPRYRPEGNGTVVFELDLLLSNGQTLTLEKTYKAKEADPGKGEGALLERDVPVLELFPNYLGKFWSRYYLLSSETERLQAEPLNRNHPAYNVSAPTEQRADTATERLRAEVTRISGEDCFPEAVALTDRSSRIPAGLVLLQPYNGHAEGDLSQGAAFRDSAIFGIDFGTSNTNVFIKRSNDDKAVALTLHFSRYLRPLTNAPVVLRRELTQAFFVPTDDKILPTPTALRVYNPSVRDHLVQDHFLYFPDRYRYPDNVVVDLKWDQESRKSLDNFLESLVFLLLVEAVWRRIGRIDFRCTYPKAFSVKRRQEYEGKWQATVNELFGAGPGNGKRVMLGSGDDSWTQNYRIQRGNYNTLHTPGAGDFSVSTTTFFATEGVAAGKFFSSRITAGVHHASPDTGAICIDVGGGTTDFSLLYGGGIKYDASVLLAGKQIANMLKSEQSRRLRQILLSDDASDALQKAAENGSRFESRLNFVLRSEHRAIAAILARESGSDAIRPLLRVLLVEFGALAFYAGHLTLALNHSLGGKMSEKVALSGLSIHWGGNAAKMLDWLDGGQFQNNETGGAKLLNYLFGGVVTQRELPDTTRLALKVTALEQRQSPGHKDEAAGGVVVMDPDAKGADAPAEDEEFGFEVPDEVTAPPGVLEGLVMGERITVNGREYAPHHVFKKEDLFDGQRSRYEDTGLEQLDKFLKALNHWGKNFGLLDPAETVELTDANRRTIRNNVRTRMANEAEKKDDDRMVEPVFILQVKELLELMATVA